MQMFLASNIAVDTYISRDRYTVRILFTLSLQKTADFNLLIQRFIFLIFQLYSFLSCYLFQFHSQSDLTSLESNQSNYLV